MSHIKISPFSMILTRWFKVFIYLGDLTWNILQFNDDDDDDNNKDNSAHLIKYSIMGM